MVCTVPTYGTGHSTAIVSAQAGKCDYIQADLREPENILKGAARTLDYALPVAVSLLQILQFIPDEGDPWGLVATITDALPVFDGLELVDPGLVQLHRWRPGPGADTSAYEVPALAGVARKP